MTGQEVLFSIDFASPIFLFNFAPDLQAWIRNGNLDPDWSRVGADIIGGGSTFNMAFEVRGVPEPASLVLLGSGLVVLARRVTRGNRTSL